MTSIALFHLRFHFSKPTVQVSTPTYHGKNLSLESKGKMNWLGLVSSRVPICKCNDLRRIIAINNVVQAVSWRFWSATSKAIVVDLERNWWKHHDVSPGLTTVSPSLSSVPFVSVASCSWSTSDPRPRGGCAPSSKVGTCEKVSAGDWLRSLSYLKVWWWMLRAETQSMHMFIPRHLSQCRICRGCSSSSSKNCVSSFSVGIYCHLSSFRHLEMSGIHDVFLPSGTIM